MRRGPFAEPLTHGRGGCCGCEVRLALVVLDHADSPCLQVYWGTFGSLQESIVFLRMSACTVEYQNKTYVEFLGRWSFGRVLHQALFNHVIQDLWECITSGELGGGFEDNLLKQI